MKTRDKFVVAWLVLQYLISWGLSLARLFQVHFWDQRYALQKLQEPREGLNQGFQEIGESYYQSRYVFFLPHVIGAVLWWNLYFLQLIPKVRHWKKKLLHRSLGRFLMVVLVLQTSSGIGLAATSDSNVIKLVSYVLGIAVVYCIVQAWRYAYWRDIPRHKYWVIRLVGYMQTIALFGFWLSILIISHGLQSKCGWKGLYPILDDNSTREEWADVVQDMYDDAEILCILHAILTTEWYLAAEQGMTESPVDNRESSKAEDNSSDECLSSESSTFSLGNNYNTMNNTAGDNSEKK